MRLLSKIVFGDYYKIEKTFDQDLNEIIVKLFTLLSIEGVKGTIKHGEIILNWGDGSNKFLFHGKLTESEGKAKLTGEFILGTFHSIKFLIWFSFWIIGYVLIEIEQFGFYREGDDLFLLAFIIIGFLMLIVFLIRSNNKVKEISNAIEKL